MDILSIKWGTAPPLLNSSGKLVRAFGTASARVSDPQRFAAACSAAGIAAQDDPAPVLRAWIRAALSACLELPAQDLDALSQAVQESVRSEFEAAGLELTELVIESWQIAENPPLTRDMGDPAPIPASGFSFNLPPSMLTNNLVPPVGDFDLPMQLPAAAAYAQVTPEELLRLIHEGVLPATAVDGQYYILPSNLDKLKGTP